MAGSKEKSFRKMKRSYTWLSIVSFVLIMVVSAVLINGTIVFFGLYTVNSKVDGQYDLVKHMATVYEKGLADDDKGMRELLREECPDFVVRDADGNEVESNGKNTCSDNGGAPAYQNKDREYSVYEDTENHLLNFSDGGLIIPDIFALDQIEKSVFSLDEIEVGFSIEMDSETDDVHVYEDSPRVFYMPIWIETQLSNGNRFAAKGYVQVRLLDAIVFIVISLVLNLVLLIILVVQLVKIIRGLIRKKKMTELFLVDEVTKGNNWMAFKLKGDRILKKGKNADKRYAMIHLVIVKYRNYCMCHSLEEGQRLLLAISGQIEQSLKPKDELCAHVSSSSFAILMEAETDDVVRERLGQILEKLKGVHLPSEGPQQPGHSDTFRTFNFQAGVQIIEPSTIGGKKHKRIDTAIDHYYNDAVTAKSTLEVSDDDGIAFFDSKLMENERWIQMLEEHQQKALDNEEFVVFYQPKYSPENGELIGAEALVRWQSPDFGFVSPGRFIPIFENNGFITAIDHYMICHVARDQKRWLDEGMKCVPVSVNVSRAHFAEKDLADQIRNMVDEVGIPHELIEIELTESAFFDDKPAIIDTIEALKGYGFSVSMDDFGSGYSSLNSLKDMNLDVLKLDADFFRGDADPARKEAVVSEAIRLAKRLNMRTVAEGVEDKDQVEFLKNQGCDMIQGYYFAKPMPKEEYEGRMRNKYYMPGK